MPGSMPDLWNGGSGWSVAIQDWTLDVHDVVVVPDGSLISSLHVPAGLAGAVAVTGSKLPANVYVKIALLLLKIPFREVVELKVPFGRIATRTISMKSLPLPEGKQFSVVPRLMFKILVPSGATKNERPFVKACR